MALKVLVRIHSAPLRSRLARESRLQVLAISYVRIEGQFPTLEELIGSSV